MVHSLRTRLIVSYTVLVALVLGIVTIVSSVFAFEFLTRPTAEALENAVASARTIVLESDPRTPTAELERRIALEASRRGMHLVPPPSVDNDRQQDRGIHSHELLALSGFLGLPPRAVTVRDRHVLIAPNRQRVLDAMVMYVEVLTLSLAILIAIAWLIARWITEQAIFPLVTVTKELRRFASGDFTPRSLSTRDRSELGDLIAAYNGAAAQVAAAFMERERVESYMRNFIADAGHELRTPLTVIVGYLTILRRGGFNDKEIRASAFRALDAETKRMRGFLERLVALMKLERPEAAQIRAVRLRAVTEAAIAAEVAARQGVVELEGDAEAVADPVELQEALGNLVQNGLKYGAGTPVRIQITSEAASATIRVTDRGPGIRDEERSRIFERFFRGEGRGDIEGSGLGLAIARRAVARSGGTLELESGAPGQTTFTIRLSSRRAHEDATRPLQLH